MVTIICQSAIAHIFNFIFLLTIDFNAFCTDDAQNHIPDVFNDETVENGIYFDFLFYFLLFLF